MSGGGVASKWDRERSDPLVLEWRRELAALVCSSLHQPNSESLFLPHPLCQIVCGYVSSPLSFPLWQRIRALTPLLSQLPTTQSYDRRVPGDVATCIEAAGTGTGTGTGPVIKSCDFHFEFDHIRYTDKTYAVRSGREFLDDWKNGLSFRWKKFKPSATAASAASDPLLIIGAHFESIVTESETVRFLYFEIEEDYNGRVDWTLHEPAELAEGRTDSFQHPLPSRGGWYPSDPLRVLRISTTILTGSSRQLWPRIGLPPQAYWKWRMANKR